MVCQNCIVPNVIDRGVYKEGQAWAQLGLPNNQRGHRTSLALGAVVERASFSGPGVMAGKESSFGPQAHCEKSKLLQPQGCSKVSKSSSGPKAVAGHRICTSKKGQI